MKKYFWKGHQNLSQLENGKDISLREIKSNHNLLYEEMNQLSKEINENIFNNDYVKLMLLVKRRKELYAAINAIESIYGDLHSTAINNFFSDNLKHEKLIRRQFQKVFSKFALHFIKTLHLTGKE